MMRFREGRRSCRKQHEVLDTHFGEQHRTRNVLLIVMPDITQYIMTYDYINNSQPLEWGCINDTLRDNIVKH
jgi:hypothetical protein